jgi:hypothetical protein
MASDDSVLMGFARVVAAGDEAAALALLRETPELATARVEVGASRQETREYYLEGIAHYVYRGDTALHVAAAAHRLEVVRALIAAGADVRARNRRGAEPLHYAADGVPGSEWWRPEEQAAVIACLLEAGAMVDAADPSGVTALHRAVRARCAAAVQALLDGGADPFLANDRGSTPLELALGANGRGGSGSVAAKREQRQILMVLRQRTGMVGQLRPRRSH